MIINNNYQFIYIHVPKTAGTTVSTTLHGYAGPTDIDLGGAVAKIGDTRRHEIAATLNKIWPREFGLEKHSKVARVRHRLGQRLWLSYFKFAFVRSPFARTYSGFRFAQRNNSMDGALENMTFSDFLNSEYFQELKILPIQSQAEFLKPIDQLNFIGRQENLVEDMKFVCSVIEKRRVTSVDIPDLNRSAKPDEWRAMSEDDKDIIRTVLASDFEELGYSKEDGSIIREEVLI